jgi:hypothetical protein
MREFQFFESTIEKTHFANCVLKTKREKTHIFDVNREGGRINIRQRWWMRRDISLKTINIKFHRVW